MENEKCPSMKNRKQTAFSTDGARITRYTSEKN